MDHQKERELIERYLSGNCSAEEREWIDQWYIARSGEVQDELAEPNYELVKTEMLRSIQSRAYAVQHKLWPQPAPNWIRRIAGIAAAIAVIVFGVWFYNYNSAEILKQVQNDVVVNDIAPGKNRATLTVNGKTINLSDAKSGVVIGVDKIMYNDNSVISDNTPSSQQSAATRTEPSASSAQQHLLSSIDKRSLGTLEMTITTPRGGTYQITLADGTRVWLNAASSLTYTKALNKNGQRRVKLTGEGYFEVAKDKKHPFVVSTDKQQVEVMGTHFNINAYANERVVKTTLLEGSVRVSAKTQTKLLKAGQQAILSDKGMVLKNVETEDAVDWKNGYFMFNNESLEGGLKRIARWYNVQIVYRDESLKEEPFFGRISKFEKISKVLNMLERTDVVRFEINGDKIIVHRKK